MKSEESVEFVDPALKAAVQRAWGAECCPEALRARLLAGELGRTTHPISRRSIGRSWMIWPMAVAAAVLLAVGLPYLFHSLSSVSRSPIAALPIGLQNDLITTHDHCCKEVDHQHFPVSKDNTAGIVSAMKARLSRAILVAKPSDTTWNFTGASICAVGTTKAGHLVFVRGGDALSVFSLPLELLPTMKDGDRVEMNSAGHPIVAFAKDGALFCLVESGSPSTVGIEQLSKLRDELQPQVIAAGQSEPRATVAELIYPANR